MLQLRNKTPFKAALGVLPGESGADTLYIAAKATFVLSRPVRIAEEQVPLSLQDLYRGEPGESSLVAASEIHLAKPSTDVVLVGHAQAPDGRPVSQLDVTVSVADREKTVRVFGDRVWTGGLVPPLITSPIPFTMIPLVYERAFGGTCVVDRSERQVASEPRNPVGCGFTGKRRRKEMKGMPVPNLEDPSALLSEPGDRPAPAGFGYVAPSWEPRKSFAGTYDDAWKETRAPYLPADFDSRFFHVAHPDLVCRTHLEGGEPVEVVNASAKGRLQFNLPVCRMRASVRIGRRCEEPALKMESVLIAPDEDRLNLLWRGSLPCDKMALRIECVDLRLEGMGMTPC